MEAVVVTKEKIYWAPAKNYRLYLSKDDPERVGSYQREVRNQRGDVVQVATPVIWGSNIFSTVDPAVQKIIEQSAAFKNGEIVICKSIEEANQRTAGKVLAKVVTSGMVTLSEETIKVGSLDEAHRVMRDQISGGIG